MHSSRALSLLRPTASELADFSDAASFVVRHATNAFESFRVRASSAIDAKSILVADGFIGRMAVVISVDEVNAAKAAGADMDSGLRYSAGFHPSLPRSEILSELNRALDYHSRVVAR